MPTTEAPFGAWTVTFETGEIARQARGAAVVRAGKAVVLGTVVTAPGDPSADFVPLTVEYREKAAAFGRIPGGVMRREMRASEREVLVSRLIDRALRPLFPSLVRDEIQIQVTVLSGDPALNMPGLGLLAASAALHLSPVPWNGPVAGFPAALCDSGWRLGTVPPKDDPCSFELIASCAPCGFTMIEGAGGPATEERILEALAAAADAAGPVLAAIEELRAAAGAPKSPLPSEGDVSAEVDVAAAVDAALAIGDKAARRAALETARMTAGALPPAAFDAAVRARFRHALLAGGARSDGRAPGDLRSIDAKAGWLPVPHGSALFTRGGTQAAVSCTLGAKGNEALMETQAGAERKSFMLHYNFPPFSVGELRNLRGIARREQGHGSLAEAALAPVIPSQRKWPYVVRIESDILESDGSSSMATVCGASLALMDAGVPVGEPVAGIAMGLVEAGESSVILSDITGDEDQYGDLDFKLAGTRGGLTALQMDTKSETLGVERLAAVMDRARAGRHQILDRMALVLDAPRGERKATAPEVARTRIPQTMIRLVIGQKGSTIKALQDRHSVEIRVQDEGEISVYGETKEAVADALRQIEDLAGTVRVGADYEGRVVKLVDSGLFVRIFESAEGWLHISEWEAGRTADLRQVAAVGDAVRVRVLGVDERGRIRVSRRAALESALSGGATG